MKHLTSSLLVAGGVAVLAASLYIYNLYFSDLSTLSIISEKQPKKKESFDQKRDSSGRFTSTEKTEQ